MDIPIEERLNRIALIVSEAAREADDLAAAYVHLGLVEQHELVAPDGLAHARQRLVMAAHAARCTGSGVAKSGSPMLRWMIDRPAAASSSAFLTTSIT